MSIQSELNRIKANISAAYSAVEEKGGTLPEEQTSANLAAAILGLAVDDGMDRIFAEVYGLNLSDGESKQAKFICPGYSDRLVVTDTMTVREVVETLNELAPMFGYPMSYDQASGRIIAAGSSGNKESVQVVVDGNAVHPL